MLGRSWNYAAHFLVRDILSRQRREDWKLEDPLCLNRGDFLVTKFAPQKTLVPSVSDSWLSTQCFTLIGVQLSYLGACSCFVLFRQLTAGDCSKPENALMDIGNVLLYIFCMMHSFWRNLIKQTGGYEQKSKQSARRSWFFLKPGKKKLPTIQQ